MFASIKYKNIIKHKLLKCVQDNAFIKKKIQT